MIKVINLKRSTSRKEQFIKNNPNVNYSFHEGVDGSTLSKKFLAESGLFDGRLPYTKGAFGCALSHLSLWEEAINTNRAITVIEDDVILRADFEPEHNKMIDSIGGGWDIVLWGWNFDHVLSVNVMPDISPVIMIFNQQQLRNSVPNFYNSKSSSTLMSLDKCFGIPAYTISAQGAVKFKEQCFPLLPFEIEFPLMSYQMQNNGIDIAMNSLYPSLNAYACFPPLAITKNERNSSTIQNSIYF
ncbi:glycosyltransferase family 25 protein [Polynucleobacter sp. AP-Ainpum-60-G11]|uniref:glycosyltransferase family 25 protein n=1 Tax=Polynucleobacter sp. AP-Ainpum-60-G11 TaxID=2576926 RepID=UPI001BFD89FC|nr:glycosyltransferase family 25 protein [Polynucleobacter sp. AP-Ainpum-60-G11]QWE26840.1 glycosyltransferase family 25 protein [Polynucleobacter sp. AP-Ainpum-60-G11]